VEHSCVVAASTHFAPAAFGSCGSDNNRSATAAAAAVGIRPAAGVADNNHPAAGVGVVGNNAPEHRPRMKSPWLRQITLEKVWLGRMV